MKQDFTHEELIEKIERLKLSLSLRNLDNIPIC